MRIAICDDDIRDHAHFINALHTWDPASRPERFYTGKDLLEAAKKQSFDIVFLDIYLPEGNGIEIATEIKKLSAETGVVFLTVSKEHAIEAFSLHALHYLVKPVSTEGIAESFYRLRQFRRKQRKTILLPIGREKYTVYLDEINYIQSVNHVKEIHLIDGQILQAWMTLEEIQNYVGENFLKINRGIIVNMEQIVKMDAEFCTLNDGTAFRFPRRGRQSIREAYDEYLFARLSNRNAMAAYFKKIKKGGR